VVKGLGADSETTVLVVAFEGEVRMIFGHAQLNPVLRRVRWFGYEGTRWSPSFPKVPKEVGDMMVEVSFSGLFASPEENPVTISFENAYRERYGKDPTPYSYYSYDAAWLACLAVLNAAKYDGEAIKAVLPSVAERYLGASGYKKLDANGDVLGADYQIWRSVLENGVYKYKVIGVWKIASEELLFY